MTTQEIKTENNIVILINKQRCSTCDGTRKIYKGTKYERKCYICDGEGETIINSIAIGKLK